MQHFAHQLLLISQQHCNLSSRLFQVSRGCMAVESKLKNTSKHPSMALQAEEREPNILQAIEKRCQIKNSLKFRKIRRTSAASVIEPGFHRQGLQQHAKLFLSADLIKIPVRE